MLKTIYDLDYRELLLQLRRAREELGLTQAEAAKRLFMTQSSLSKCENGERRIDIIELARFAKAYEKELLYFIPKNLLKKDSSDTE